MFSRPTVSHVCGSLQGLAIGFKPGRGPPARTGAGMNDITWTETAVCGICMGPLGSDSTENPWPLPTEMKTTQACINGHVFHKGCLLKSMRGVTGRKCPLCMQPMLKEICDKLDMDMPRTSLLNVNVNTSNDPDDAGPSVPRLPQPGPPQDYFAQIAHQRSLMRAANTPGNRESGQAEIVAAETRVRRTELTAQNYRDRAARAEQLGHASEAARLRESAEQETNLVEFHRLILEGLRETLREWATREHELLEALRTAMRQASAMQEYGNAPELTQLADMRVADARARLRQHRDRPNGWLLERYHNRRRDRSREEAEAEDRMLVQRMERAQPPAPSAPAPSAPLRRPRLTTSSRRTMRRIQLSDDNDGSDDSDDAGVDGDDGPGPSGGAGPSDGAGPSRRQPPPMPPP
ncbi:MAG: hypothetical protein CMB11_08320 [Euryarchaeota archaeon]|nr:hypothetical protein [Euryarchaeota archaeon]